VNETLRKLAAQIEHFNARQEECLAAADAEGVSDEDRKARLAEFDRLQAEKDRARESYSRAERLERDREWSAAPGRAPVADRPHNPLPPATGAHPDDDGYGFSAARVRVPARARRHGPLKAFKGPDAEREAYAAGLWLAGALFGHGPSAARARELGMEFVSDPAAAGPSASLTGLSNQSGGFFVPDVIETRVIEITQAYGILRQRAEVVPMTSDSQSSPRWSSAMTAYWIGRGSKPTSSDPAWNAVQLIARDLGALTKIARQLSEDALIDLAEKVTLNVARAFALAEDNAGFNGDGTSTYGGIVGLLTKVVDAANSNSLVTATGHTTVSALTNADFLAVTGKAPNYPGADWRWYCHKQVWSQSMAALQLAGGGNRVSEIAAGGQMAYLGYPVEFVNVMPAAPSSGNVAVLFADLSLAVKIGDRRGRTVQAGYENDDFTKQLMTLLGTQRVDVNCHTIIDPLGDANAPGGPVMALKLG